MDHTRQKLFSVAGMLAMLVRIGLTSQSDATAVADILEHKRAALRSRGPIPGWRIKSVRRKGGRRHAHPKVRTDHWWSAHPKAREAGPVTPPIIFGRGQNRKTRVVV